MADYGNSAIPAIPTLFLLTGGLPWETWEPNLYRFVYNTPTTLVDRDGRIVWPLVIVGGALLGWGAYNAWEYWNESMNNAMNLRKQSNGLPTTHPNFPVVCDNVRTNSLNLAKNMPGTQFTGPSVPPYKWHQLPGLAWKKFVGLFNKLME